MLCLGFMVLQVRSVIFIWIGVKFTQKKAWKHPPFECESSFFRFGNPFRTINFDSVVHIFIRVPYWCRRCGILGSLYGGNLLWKTVKTHDTVQHPWHLYVFMWTGENTRVSSSIMYQHSRLRRIYCKLLDRQNGIKCQTKSAF